MIETTMSDFSSVVFLFLLAGVLTFFIRSFCKQFLGHIYLRGRMQGLEDAEKIKSEVQEEFQGKLKEELREVGTQSFYAGYKAGAMAYAGVEVLDSDLPKTNVNFVDELDEEIQKEFKSVTHFGENVQVRRVSRNVVDRLDELVDAPTDKTKIN